MAIQVSEIERQGRAVMADGVLTKTAPEATEVTVARKHVLSASWRKALSYDRAASINAFFAALLVVWVLAELAIYQTAYNLVVAAPAVGVFGMASRSIAADHGARRWLRVSGWSCVSLVGLCGVFFVGSLTETPVDVSCAISSGIFGAVFGLAGWYQLNRAR
jgi:hypothetical protein